MPSLGARLFAGEGEMAGLIRAKDWSQTPLGPIESWPQSLRTAVSICLGSRHPIVLWWGPERWMFYNDGYRPLLGERKHPQFLGRPGQECWAEIWDIIGPMMDRVIDTGEATWSEDLLLLMLRYSYLEETYYTFSYSPIRDEEGRPSGIFNACTESTARVLDRRRLKTLREMAVEARTGHEAARLCAEILGRAKRDIPFALVYLLDRVGTHLHLAGHAGIEPGTSASPLTVAMGDVDAVGWPLARVAGNGHAETVGDLPERFGCLPREPWNEPPHQAMLLPVPRAGARPAGVLVLGISPRRAFDDDYRGFFDLVAGHVATAVSNAHAWEQERDRADKLAELDRAKTAFFSNVSHEFRTPLALILGPLEDVLGDPAGVLGREMVETVHRSALRLLRLVNNLLDFSRIEADRLQSSFEAADLPILTAGLAGSFRSLVESAGLKLVVDCPPLGQPVYVDPSQWEKIVLNLLSNAFKFTLEGEIAVRLHTVDGHIELSVSDTGIGIPAEELPKIFDRFHRVEGARGRSFEGTGIGLALVHELVKQHGGRVGVESVVGKGSTFLVSLPTGSDHLPKDRISPVVPSQGEVTGVAPHVLEAAQWLRSGNVAFAGATAVDVPKPPGSGVATPTSKARVLVADDNADLREHLVRLLGSRWVVEAVADGQSAFESALERPPELVLSDVMMPRMNGVALLRALRADPRTSTIPVILLSARAGEEAVVAGLETGADDYLVKPFSARELISRVATHLEMARVRRVATDVANELAETRAALLKDVERKNRELEAFSYSVSHDLRAPLRGIDGFSRALLEDYGAKLDAKGQDYLRRVRAGAQRMGNIIDDLNKLSRMERTEVRRQRVDLSRMARQAIDLLRKSAPERSVEIVVQPHVEAVVDAGLVQIALENLLGNAWKFTIRSPNPTIEFGSARENGRTTLFVRDNGAGFNPAYAGNLFTPFHRLHSDDEFPGTGIGLAIVQRVVDRHGGRVWAESAEGKGATFYLTLSPPEEQR